MASILAIVLLSYIGSYLRIRARAMAEAEEYGLAGLLYVPFEYAKAREDLTMHHVLSVLYAPMNLIDQQVFGGQYPLDCIIWRLSG